MMWHILVSVDYQKRIFKLLLYDYIEKNITKLQVSEFNGEIYGLYIKINKES